MEPLKETDLAKTDTKAKEDNRATLVEIEVDMEMEINLIPVKEVLLDFQEKKFNYDYSKNSIISIIF